jgi:molybdenum cofactor biosynthesis enzyme MoaA
MIIQKNRQKESFDFANINLLGKCNANCYFCLGKDIEQQLKNKNQLNVHFSEWNNFETFLAKCKSHNIKKLYITGQTADGLQYKYLDEVVDYLQTQDFIVGVRTNGYLALQKIDTIKKMKGGIGYSIHTLNKETNRKIMGRDLIPNWNEIIPQSGANIRVSIVVNRFNLSEIMSIIEFLSKFDNIRYIQMRRISTDTRMDEFESDIKLYEELYQDISSKYKQIGEFYKAQQFSIFNKEVIFWRTVETSINSINYFTDGVFSEEYFIVEGYLKHI